MAGAAARVLTVPRSRKGPADGRAGFAAGGGRHATWPRVATPSPRPPSLAARLLLTAVAIAARRHERGDRPGEVGEFGRDDELRRRRGAELVERVEVLK